MSRKRISLSHQIPLLFIVSYTVIAVLVVFFVYRRFEDRTVKDYERMADGLTMLMEEALDKDKLDQYIEKNYSMEEYNDILKYYYSLKASYPDVLYMYVYIFNQSDPPDATVIIDLDEEYTEDPPQDSIDWIGQKYVMDEPFASEVDKMIYGKKPLFHVVHTADGEYLLSYGRPILDKNGRYLCTACVDFSMDGVHRQDLEFVKRLSLTMGGAMLIILLINILIIRVKVTRPLNRIVKCIDSFKYETEDDQFYNLAAVEDLGIMNRNEIGSLYNSLLATMKASVFYMSHLNQAQSKIREKEEDIQKISKMTYKDALTGVRNKSAYVEDLAELNESLAAEETAFSVVMADINNLKFINDTYGHEAGDAYIKGSCLMICRIFDHSPVYRIGGDEFVIISRGQDYEERDGLLSQLAEAFQKTYLNTEVPDHERYSASLGMAENQPGETVEEVVRRADEAMYQNKLAFKETYGSYR